MPIAPVPFVRAAPWLLALALAVSCTARRDRCAEAACAYPDHCNPKTAACERTCKDDEDCGFPSLVCVGGECTARCAGVSCGPAEYCEPITGACIVDSELSCAVDSDCDDDTKRCETGACVSKCKGVDCDPDFGEVCEPTTGECVGGRRCTVAADCPRPGEQCESGLCVASRFMGCDANTACAAGLDCVGNGGYMTCAAPCTASTDCRVGERCVVDDGGPATAFANHCLFNLCRPGGDMYGFFQDAQFMGPCNAAGVGDGTCLGPFPGDEGGDSGVCLGEGTAPHGGACREDALHGSPDACQDGLCVGAEETGVGFCLETCSLFDGTSCQDVGGTPYACLPVWEVNGLCVTSSSPPVAPDAACVPVEFQMPCVEDHACVPDAQSGPVCQALCDVAAAAGEAGACAAGDCQLAQPAENDRLGLCVVP